MSETNSEIQTPSNDGIKLNGLFAFKEGMATVTTKKASQFL